MCKLGITEDKGATLAQQMAGTVDPRCNKGPRDWQNLFAIMRFCFVYFIITGVMKIVHYMEDFVI